MTGRVTTDEYQAPPDWVAAVLQRRSYYVTILLAAAVVLRLVGALALTWDDFVVLAVMYVSAELASRLSRRASAEPSGARMLEWYFLAEVLGIAAVTWWMSGTRWLGCAGLLIELVLANMVLPRPSALRVSGFAIIAFIAITWGEALGVLRSTSAFGLPSMTGNYQLAVAATLLGGLIMLFTADVLRHTAALMRAHDARREAGERLQTVGRFGTAIAHDATNVLTVIRLNIEELEAILPEDHAGRPAVQALTSAAEHGRALARQLLNYGRRDVGPQVRLDVGEVMRNMEPFVGRLIGPRMTLRVRVPAPSPVILGDATQLEQVVVNLAVNARDALAKRGDIEVGVDQLLAEGRPSLPLLADGKRAELMTGTSPENGRWCRITMMDGGTGIAKDVLPHVLEPFYTTKTADQGSGVGLATVQDVLAGVGGHIRIATGEGRGTRVDVYWPSAPEDW